MKSKGKKYDWEIGKPPPRLDEHSQTKHRLVSDYLKRYIEIVMSNASMEKLSLNIVDGFAGGGRYIDILSQQLTNGSPFLILEAIKDAEISLNINRKKQRYIDAEYHFIEKEASHLDYLKNEFKNTSLDHEKLKSHIHLYKSTFKDAAPSIINQIKKRNPRTQRAIFILDQYAYKDVPFETIRHIFQTLTNSEVILTFNYDSAQAYISDHANNRKAFENINLDKYIAWDRLIQFKEQNRWHSAIQEQLSSAIYQASGAKHMTLFFIHPKKGQSYWLVHLSKVYKARDVMMDLHWKHANYDPLNQHFSHHLHTGLFALGYKALETPEQNSFNFTEEKILDQNTEQRCIDNLSVELPRLICDNHKIITFSELTDQLGSFSVASEQHFKKALQGPMQNKEIIICTNEGGVRRSALQINYSDIIKYNQHPLIFLPGK